MHHNILYIVKYAQLNDIMKWSPSQQDREQMRWLSHEKGTMQCYLCGGHLKIL